jgi:Response regulator receiver domain
MSKPFRAHTPGQCDGDDGYGGGGMTRKLLLIEDDADIREIVALTLAFTTDWVVQSASTGAEGLAMAEAWQPDGVVLDFMLPDMDGLAVATALRGASVTAALPILLLSARVPLVPPLSPGAPGAPDRRAWRVRHSPALLASQIAECFAWS